MHQVQHDYNAAELVTDIELLPRAQCAKSVLLCICTAVPWPHIGMGAHGAQI